MYKWYEKDAGKIRSNCALCCQYRLLPAMYLHMYFWGHLARFGHSESRAGLPCTDSVREPLPMHTELWGWENFLVILIHECQLTFINTSICWPIYWASKARVVFLGSKHFPALYWLSYPGHCGDCHSKHRVIHILRHTMIRNSNFTGRVLWAKTRSKPPTIVCAKSVRFPRISMSDIHREPFQFSKRIGSMLPAAGTHPIG